MGKGSESRLNDLAAALAAYMERRSGSTADTDEEFLERHAEIRELLEPMLQGEPAEGDPAGKTLGDFTLIREIGRGGMGIVYEARQRSLDRRVALKVLPAHLTLTPAAVARFKREAGTAARLEHEGIVEIHTVGSEGDTHFFAMEFVPGAPLDRVLARIRGKPVDALPGNMIGEAIREARHRPADTLAAADPSPPPAIWQRGYVEAVVDTAAQVAEALHHAHESGVLHRDVKPANILLRDDGSAVLTDFGLARETDLPHLTRTGDIAGTPCYMSPEQVRGDRAHMDARSDVFSLGATLYELLTLERPFGGDTVEALQGQILRKVPTDPGRLNPNLAPDLCAVVMKTLEKDPAHRYENAAALAADLHAILEYRPVSARRAPAPVRLMRWAKREKLKAALVAVLAFSVPSLAGLTGYLLASAPERARGREAFRREQVERALTEGFLQLGESRPAEAIRAFERALAHDPQCAGAVAGIALVHKRKGRGDVALRWLDRRQFEDPEKQRALDRVRAYVLGAIGAKADAGRLHERLGDPKGSLDLFIAGLEMHESASRFEDRKALIEAANLLARAVATSPAPRPYYHFELLKAADSAGERETARRSLEALQTHRPGSALTLLAQGYAWDKSAPEQAMASYSEVLERNPQDVIALVNRGALKGNNGDFAGAKEDFRRALEIDPSYGLPYFNLGSILREEKRFDESIDALRNAVRLEPERPRYWSRLGWSLRKAGRYAEARDAYRRALAVHPGHVGSWYRLGNVLKDLGQREEALAAYRKAVEFGPDDYMPHQILGRELLRSGNTAEAEPLIRRVLELKPDSFYATNDLGILLYRTERWEESERTFRRALELASEARDRAQVLGNLGTLLAGQEEYDEAVEALRKAIDLEPDMMALYSSLAGVHQARGDLDALATALEAALAVKPRHREFHEKLVQLHARRRDWVRLEEELERWIEVNPSSAQARNDLAWFLVNPRSPAEVRDAETGLAVAREAVALSKERSPACLYTLAEAQRANGQEAEARNTAEKALRLLAAGVKAQLKIRRLLKQRFPAAVAKVRVRRP